MAEASRSTPREILPPRASSTRTSSRSSYRGRTVDLHTPVDATRGRRSTPVRATDPDGPRGHPPLDRARHGRRRAAALPGHQGHHRPRDRGRLLLRLRQARAAASPTRTSRRSSRRCSRSSRRTRPFRREVVTRDEAHAHLREDGRDVQASRSSTPSRAGEEISLYKHGAPRRRVGRRLRGPARARRPGYLRAVKLTQRRRRVLARRRAQPDAPAHLRHRVPDAGGARRAPEAARGGEGSATTASSARSSTSFMFDEVAPAMPFFLPQGAFVYNRARRVRARPLRARTATRRSSRRRSSTRSSFATSGHLGELQREHVPPRGPRTCSRSAATQAQARRQARRRQLQERRVRAEADELPEPLRHLRRAPAQLPRAAVARGRLRAPASLRARRRRARPRARAQLLPGRRAHLLRRRSRSPSEIETFIELLLRRVQGVRLRRRSTSSSRPAPRSASAPTTQWDTRREARSPRRSSERGLAVRDLAGRGRVLRPEDRVPRAGRAQAVAGSSARIQFDPNLPERFELEYIGRGRQGRTGRSCSTARSSARSSASSASTSSTAAGNFPAWLAPEQAIVLTVSEKSDDYARERGRRRSRAKGLRVDADLVERQARREDPQRAPAARTRTSLVVGPKEAESAARVGRRDPRRRRASSGADAGSSELARPPHRRERPAPATPRPAASAPRADRAISSASGEPGHAGRQRAVHRARRSRSTTMAMGHPRFDPRQQQRGPQIRVNHRIRVPEVRVIAPTASMLGVLQTQEALRMAQEQGLDLVEVNPKAEPPVCKILDFGKYKYDEKKKAARGASASRPSSRSRRSSSARRRTTTTSTSRSRAARRFLEAGHKVKFTVRFRGREITHPEKAHEQLDFIVKAARGHRQRRDAPDDGSAHDDAPRRAEAGRHAEGRAAAGAARRRRASRPRRKASRCRPRRRRSSSRRTTTTTMTTMTTTTTSDGEGEAGGAEGDEKKSAN